MTIHLWAGRSPSLSLKPRPPVWKATLKWVYLRAQPCTPTQKLILVLITLEKEWIHCLKLTFSHNKHWNSIRKHWRGNWIDMLDQVYTQHSLFSCLSFLWYGIFLEETVMSHFPIASNTLWICELNVGHMCFDENLPMCFYCIFIDKLPNHQKTDVNRIWFITILFCLL